MDRRALLVEEQLDHRLRDHVRTDADSIDIVVGQINYLWFGTPFTCGGLSVGPDPTADPVPVLTAVDCNFSFRATTGGQVWFNNNGTCTCQDPSATAQTTWGNVKSLYR